MTYSADKRGLARLLREDTAERFNFNRIANRSSCPMAFDVCGVIGIKRSFPVGFADYFFLAACTWLRNSRGSSIAKVQSHEYKLRKERTAVSRHTS